MNPFILSCIEDCFIESGKFSKCSAYGDHFSKAFEIRESTRICFCIDGDRERLIIPEKMLFFHSNLEKCACFGSQQFCDCSDGFQFFDESCFPIQRSIQRRTSLRCPEGEIPFEDVCGVDNYSFLLFFSFLRSFVSALATKFWTAV